MTAPTQSQAVRAIKAVRHNRLEHMLAQGAKGASHAFDIQDIDKQ
jgi:hypothetical protein